MQTTTDWLPLPLQTRHWSSSSWQNKILVLCPKTVFQFWPYGWVSFFSGWVGRGGVTKQNHYRDHTPKSELVYWNFWQWKNFAWRESHCVHKQNVKRKCWSQKLRNPLVFSRVKSSVIEKSLSLSVHKHSQINQVLSILYLLYIEIYPSVWSPLNSVWNKYERNILKIWSLGVSFVFPPSECSVLCLSQILCVVLCCVGYSVWMFSFLT